MIDQRLSQVRDEVRNTAGFGGANASQQGVSVSYMHCHQTLFRALSNCIHENAQLLLSMLSSWAHCSPFLVGKVGKQLI